LRKAVSEIIILLLIASVLILCFEIHPVSSSGTIYIRADGSIDPADATISTLDNVTYTLTENISSNADGIRIERDDIILDGAGHTVSGIGTVGVGIILYNRRNVTIMNLVVKAFSYDGITLVNCSKNTIIRNEITNNGFPSQPYKKISAGIRLSNSSNNNIIGNNLIENSLTGIWLRLSSNNKIYHNNFVRNYAGPVDDACFHESYPPLPSICIWDNGYPSGGNYWNNNYVGDDSNSDGIGDGSYTINLYNIDYDPLMGKFYDFNVSSEHYVQAICNSSISNFQYNGDAINFNVTGDSGTTGFCRICIPTALMTAPYKVFVNDTEVSYNLLLFSNEIYSYLYFNYTHSTQEVIITPEFPSLLLLPLFMTATLVAATVYRKRKPAIKP
jgi:parallel beta-helix repeat protein